MNGAHLHLILCHIPTIGAGFTILLLLFAFVQKSKDIKRTSLWFAVITGIAALVTYLTGDSAEEIVKLIPGITETIIEPHEEYALFYLISLLLSPILHYFLSQVYFLKTFNLFSPLISLIHTDEFS